MQRHSSAFGVALVVLAVLGLAGPVAAEKLVPFNGRLEGNATFTPEPPPSTIVSVFVEAEGNATHLGRFTLTIPHQVDRADRTASGSYVFTAANGDTLTADFAGQASLTETPGVLSIVEQATITGGTGQFAQASGSFITNRLSNSITGETAGSFTGEISLGVKGER